MNKSIAEVMTRKFLIPTIILSVVIILLNACTKHAVEPEKETVEIVETESLESAYGCTHTTSLLSNRIWPAVPLLRMFTLNNQEEFDKIVKGATCSPIIDFEKHTLLIGVETLNSGYSGIEYNLKKITTDKDTLVLTVRFHVNGATVMSEPTWHVLLPKSVEGIPIKVNFEKK